MELKYEIKEKDSYKRIVDVLQNEFEFSSRLIFKLIKNNCIFLNSQKADTRLFIKSGDVISVDLSSAEDNSNIVATKMELDIIYEDDWFMVVNKPSGVAVHPSRFHYDNSLSNGIKFYFDSICLNKKIRPVNRLDLYTSGLVVFAKCEYIQEQFSKQMQNGNFQKEYLCIAKGIFKEKVGTINLPIKRKENSIIERCVDSTGKPSITHYKVLKEFNLEIETNVFEALSLVKCVLETGRTHQIRVHMSHIGHPLLGDTLYGEKNVISKISINGQALHSYKINLIHPILKRKMQFMCNPPHIFNIPG